MYLLLGMTMVLVFMVVIPYLLGSFFTSKMREDEKGLSLAILMGNMILFGMFEILAVPFIFMEMSFHMLFYIWMVLISILSIISLPIIKKEIYKKRIYNQLTKIKKPIEQLPWYNIITLFLIGLQVFSYIKYMHVDSDDAFYVGTSTTTLATDTMYQIDPYTGESYGGHIPARYILSPLSIYWAVISKASGVHPTILVHSLIPPVLILLSYMMYYNWGKRLFLGKIKEMSMFLLLVSVIHTFGNVSILTDSVFMSVRIWQGKAILAIIIIPFILYLCMGITRGGTKVIDWITLFITMISASMVSSMGIFLAPIIVGAWGIFSLLKTYRIRNTLYYLGCCLPCVVLGLLYILIQ